MGERKNAPNHFTATMSAPAKPRYEFADFLKGALIFFVACGHLIQYVGHPADNGYYLDPLFKAIYTFHMPLFMAVSGYVSLSAITRVNLQTCVFRRFRQVIIPAICWPVIYLLAKFLISVVAANSVAAGWHDFKFFLTGYRPGFWFLWAVFGATLVVAILRKFELDRPGIFALAAIAFLFAPEGAYIYLFKYTFPFFCMGYVLAKKDPATLPARLPAWGLILLVAASLGCFLRWTTDTYVYTTRMWPAPANLPNITLRLVAGVVVSVLFIYLLLAIYRRTKSKLLSDWGRRSLDIYILHFFLVEILATLIHPVPNSYWFSWLAAPLLAAVICFLSYWAGAGLEKIPWVGGPLLGKTPQRSALEKS